MNLTLSAGRGLTACFLFLFAVLVMMPDAFADELQNLKWCEHSNPDLMIGGCTALIQSGTLSQKSLAHAFASRGNAYYLKRQLDRAIQNYDQAIKLKPDFALAFNNRCWARAIDRPRTPRSR